MLDNIVKDLVELESLEIGIVGEKNVKKEKNVKEAIIFHVIKLHCHQYFREYDIW